MKKEIKNLYKAIAGLQENNCECDLPDEGTDCCKDYGACCSRAMNAPGGPIGIPGPWRCEDGVKREGCTSTSISQARWHGTGSRCLPSQSDDPREPCRISFGEHKWWTCCLPDGRCLMPATYDNSSIFKCKCKRMRGICTLSAGRPGCGACEDFKR